MSTSTWKTPWKSCVFGQSSVIFSAKYGKNKSGSKRGGNANRALATDDHGRIENG